MSDLAEIDEAESTDPRQSNDLPVNAQKVATPVLINGKLVGPDIDNYTFHATAGQKLVFEVEARRAGSAIDPAIEISMQPGTRSHAMTTLLPWGSIPVSK